MAKIVVTFNGLVQQEFLLGKPRLSIGRRPSNDVVIDHLTVSGQHAAIDTTLNGAFVIDLGSTNGTIVNGQPVKKHLLQDQDVIEIGKYKLSVDLNSSQLTSHAPIVVKASPPIVNAKIKVLNGNGAGKELRLIKPLTTLGSPGIQVIAITREQDNYFIAHVDGASFPKLNDQLLDASATKLTDGDLIEVSGIKMQFSEIA